MHFMKRQTIDLVKLYRHLLTKKHPNKHVIKLLIKLENEFEDRKAVLR